ncbi:IS3 family transposase, partial [Caldanaerobius polysaccharolyticus]|uniref:IS3 family transposase n=1 Tax=Caldanaerobius polysaccharolyticus TaxID=44256 RepID=UPI0038994670
LEEYIDYYNNKRIKCKLKGTEPGSIPDSVPRSSLIKLSNIWGSVHYRLFCFYPAISFLIFSFSLHISPETSPHASE